MANDLNDLENTSVVIRTADPNPEAYAELVSKFTLPENFLQSFKEELERTEGNLAEAFNHVLFEALADFGLLDFFEGKLDSKINGAVRELIDAIVSRHPVKNLDDVSPEGFLRHYVLPIEPLFVLFLSSKLKDLFEIKLLMDQSLEKDAKLNEYADKLDEKDGQIGAIRAEYAKEVKKITEEGPATDALTGLQPRRRYQLKLESIESKHAHEEYWVLFLDIDDFKRINDVYGHGTGDIALVEVAKIVQRYARDGEAFRIGGEELVIIFNAKGISRNAVADRATSIRRAVASKVFMDHTDSKTFSASISIGVARGEGYDIKKVVTNADAASYRVKRSGKNNVWIAGEETPVTKRNGPKSLAPQSSPLRAK